MSWPREGKPRRNTRETFGWGSLPLNISPGVTQPAAVGACRGLDLPLRPLWEIGIGWNKEIQFGYSRVTLSWLPTSVQQGSKVRTGDAMGIDRVSVVSPLSPFDLLPPSCLWASLPFSFHFTDTVNRVNPMILDRML